MSITANVVVFPLTWYKQEWNNINILNHQHIPFVTKPFLVLVNLLGWQYDSFIDIIKGMQCT